MTSNILNKICGNDTIIKKDLASCIITLLLLYKEEYNEKTNRLNRSHTYIGQNLRISPKSWYKDSFDVEVVSSMTRRGLGPTFEWIFENIHKLGEIRLGYLYNTVSNCITYKSFRIELVAYLEVKDDEVDEILEYFFGTSEESSLANYLKSKMVGNPQNDYIFYNHEEFSMVSSLNTRYMDKYMKLLETVIDYLKYKRPRRIVYFTQEPVPIQVVIEQEIEERNRPIIQARLKQEEERKREKEQKEREELEKLEKEKKEREKREKEREEQRKKRQEREQTRQETQKILNARRASILPMDPADFEYRYHRDLERYRPPTPPEMNRYTMLDAQDSVQSEDEDSMPTPQPPVPQTWTPAAQPHIPVPHSWTSAPQPLITTIRSWSRPNPLPEKKYKIVFCLHGISYSEKNDINFPFNSLKYFTPLFTFLKPTVSVMDTMTNIHNDKSELIIQKIPRRENKLSVRNMMFSLQDTETLGEFMGIYLCDVNESTPPVKILQHPHLITLAPHRQLDVAGNNMYCFYWDDIIQLSVKIIRGYLDLNKYIPRDTSLKDIELCMFCCRANSPSDPGYRHNINPLAQQWVQNLRGGNHNKLVVKNIFEETKEIQYSKLQNGESVLPVSEDQLNFYLNSPTEPTPLEIIDSLTLNEISEQLEEHHESPEVSFPVNHLDSVNVPKCPSYNKIPGKCISKKEYKNQALLFHPDRNPKCVQSANAKFKYLSNNWNKCNKSRRKSKTPNSKSKKDESKRKSRSLSRNKREGSKNV